MRKNVSWLAITLLVGLGFLVGSELFSEPAPILAKVGEKAITQDDLDELVKVYEPSRRGAPATLEDKKSLLNKLIRSLLISAEAEKEHLDRKPEIQRKLRIYQNELLVNEYVGTKITPFITVRDEEIQEIMRNNPNLVSKGTLTLREILVKTEKEANEIYEELKKGADFSKLATEKSVSQTKAKGGLVGAVPIGQVPPVFMEVLSPLKEGEFSKPVKAEDGFRIFHLVSRKEVSPEQLKQLEEKVREKILQIEKNKKTEALLEKKVEELKKQTKVEIYLDRLK